MCPAGMTQVIKEALWEDFKEHWQEWLKFLFWEIPNELIRDGLSGMWRCITRG